MQKLADKNNDWLFQMLLLAPLPKWRQLCAQLISGAIASLMERDKSPEKR
jgi:hypothetical protein